MSAPASAPPPAPPSPPYRPAPISHPRRPRPLAASVAVPASATASCRSRSSQRPATTESTSSTSRPPAFPPSRMPAPLLSAQEYVALPPSVQRKYCSSFERQRLAERSLPQAPSPDLTSAMPPRPQTSHSSQRSNSQSRSHSRTRKRLRKARNTPDCDITHAEAQWFLSLPDKIIKTCLSREEAVLLAHRCEALFIDSSDSDHGPVDDAERRGRWPREETSLHLHDSDAAAESPRPSNHLASRPLPARPSVSPRQPSLRKNMPSTHSFARHSSAPPLPSPGAFPVYHQLVRPRATSNIVTSRCSGDANDSHAKHYQDPETRLKLREYLASAQKFDEVVEYGFPSNTPPVDRSTEPPRSDPYARLASRDMQTFLRDDAVSFLSNTIEDDSDEEEEKSSVADIDAPMTPLDHDEGFRNVAQLSESNKSSMESRSGAYHPWRTNGPHDSHLAPLPQTLGNREMTLRMTLTRPELRADEAELYGWQQSEDRKHDPLALQDLPPENDDRTGMHGPFAAHASKHAKLVRKFLGKVQSVKKGK